MSEKQLSSIYAEWAKIAELDLMEATDTTVKAGHRSLKPKLKHSKFENIVVKSFAGPAAQGPGSGPGQNRRQKIW